MSVASVFLVTISSLLLLLRTVPNKKSSTYKWSIVVVISISIGVVLGMCGVPPPFLN